MHLKTYRVRNAGVYEQVRLQNVWQPSSPWLRRYVHVRLITLCGFTGRLPPRYG